MKHTKKILTGLITALIVVLASTAVFAASSYTNPAEIVADITNRTIDSVIAEKNESGKTYGAIAADANKLDEFKNEAFEMKKEKLAAQVQAGTITQEKADSILEVINNNRLTCDGIGFSKRDQGLGVGFGNGQGQGQRFGGANKGAGMGRGQGRQ